MMRAQRWAWTMFLLGFALQGTALAQGMHADKKNGFQMKAPDGWSKIPVKVEEKWIIAKWQSDKQYEGREAGIPPHVPLMRVIFFDREKTKQVASEGGSPIEVKAGEGVTVDLQAPYLDYKDYLKRNYQEGGFYLSAEEEGKVGETPVSMLEVKVEKLSYTGKKRIMTWVFHADHGDLAVEVDALEDKFDKLKPLFLASYRTFKLIPRDPTLQGGDEIDTGAKIKINEKDLSPEELKKRRLEAQEKVFKKALADIAGDKTWTNKRTAHYLVLNHAKPQFMDKIAGHAEAVRDWLDRNFGDVGEGYVQNGIIRICKDRNEESAFRKSSGDSYSEENREAVVSADSGTGAKYEMEYLGKALLQQYFYDKNEMLYRGLPPWLEYGLSEFVGSAQLKGRALAFEPDQNEMERLRDGRRQSKFLPVKDLFSVTGRDMWQGEDGMYIYTQCTSLVRYLLGPGAKQKKTAKLIRDYIARLLTVLDEDEKKEKEAQKQASGGGAKTEEEEEAAFRQRRSQNWDAKQKTLLATVFDQTFEGWSDTDWAALQKAWETATK